MGWSWNDIMNMETEIVDLAIWKMNIDRKIQNKQK